MDPHWIFHLGIHYMDLARHLFIQTFAWYTVQGNLGAIPWQAAIMAVIGTIFYPPLRRWIKDKWDRIFEYLDRILKHHSEHAQKLDKLVEKMDTLQKSHDSLHQKINDLTSDSTEKAI